MARRVFIVAACFLLIAAQLHAEIRAALSIEWLACQAEIIVVGKITKVSVTKGVHAVAYYEDCTVQVDEVLKGGVKGKELVFCLRDLSEPTAQSLVDSKAEVLLFLSRSKDHGSEQHLDNMYVPTSMQSPISLINLTNTPQDLYSKDMSILKDKEKTLNAVRAWADSKIAHSLWSEVPFNSPIHRQLWGGSSCYLVVPAEGNYRAHFMELARWDDPHKRQEAAAELCKFPGEETERVLRELLKDDTEHFLHFAADTISKVEYGVRAVACRSLKALSKPVPEMVELEREPTEQEQRSLRQSCWRKSFTAALSDGWRVVVVEDGNAVRVRDREVTTVVVICGKDNARCRLSLVPKECTALAPGYCLGINGHNNQGARNFFLDGTLPQEVKGKLIRYFGLE